MGKRRKKADRPRTTYEVYKRKMEAIRQRHESAIVAGLPPPASGTAGEWCPLCGAPLKLNINRRDGSQFLGCTHFPVCRGKKRLVGRRG